MFALEREAKEVFVSDNGCLYTFATSVDAIV
jgi:hypothetical protein